MATPTSRLKLKKQTLGSNLNQWGLSGGLNGVFDQVDVLAGYLEVNLGSATSYTFGTTNYATTGNEHMYRAVKFSGSPSSGVTVNIPAVDDFKFVENATGQTITFSNGATTATLANTFTGYIRTNGSSVITVLTLPDGVNVQTVATNIANVNLVAGQISPTNNISTLAAINAAISGVSAISTDVTAVNTDPLKTSIGTTAGAVTNINTVAGQISPTNNIATVAGADANITTVAGQISPTNNLGTVAGIASDVSTTAGANANITSVAGQISPTNNIGTVAGIASDISTTAGANANITSVAGQISPTNNIATVAGATANIATVAGQISPTNNVSTLAGISSDITTTAGVATSVTAYSKQYSAGSGDISTRADGSGTVAEGDLRFRTDTDTMRVYNGSAWEDAAPGAGNYYTKSDSDTRYAQVSNNLSDVTASTARTNLGLDALLAAKAPLASPTFTGTLASPTINASTALQIGGVAVSASAAEINYNDVTTLGTTEASKTVTADANGVVSFTNGKIEESTAITSSSNAATINLRDGDNFTHTLSENVTYTFSNPAANGKVSAFTLKVTQDSTARTITWPTSVDWAAATAPTLSTDSGAIDVFVFTTYDGGTTYYGFTAGQAMA